MQPRSRYVLTSLTTLALLLVAVTLPAVAQVTALEPDFAVNSYTPGDQYSPSASSNAAGEAVVAWVGRRPFPFTSTERDGIFTQRFNAQGEAVGAEFAAVWLNGTLRSEPAVAMGADGSFAVAWIERRTGTNEARLLLSRFGAAGNVLFSRVEVEASLGNALSPAVAIAPAGSIVVAWRSIGFDGNIFVRGFTLTGEPWGPEERVNSDSIVSLGPSLAALRDNRYVVAWTRGDEQFLDNDVMARILSFEGAPVSSELTVDGQPSGFQLDPAVTAVGADGFAVAWVDTSDQLIDTQIYGRVFDGAGLPTTAPFPVSQLEEEVGSYSPSIASSPGNLLFSWNHLPDHTSPGTRPVVRGFDLHGAPLGSQSFANSFESTVEAGPQLAALGAGRFLNVWNSGPLSPSVAFPPAGIDGDRTSIAGRTFSLASDQLFLNQRRFRLEVDWRTPDGKTGRGQAVAQTQDTGYFWFFNADNIELMIKVLDGRPVNGAFWVFYGSLTNVEFTLTVTDTQTGVEKEFPNPQGTLQSIADTNAFPAGGSPLSALAASSLASPALSQGAPGALFELDGVASPLAGKAAGACVRGSQNLCLNNSRFRLEIDWRDPRTGNSGQGRAVGLTDDTGYFWFFGRDNIELVVKVLDGRPVNGNFWVFYGALTDLEYTLTVTDTETGEERTYFNPPFTLTSLADTAAF